MKQFSFWESTVRFGLASIGYFLLVDVYWYYRSPDLSSYNNILLAFTIAAYLLLRIFFKKAPIDIIGCFFLSFVILILTSVICNHEYFVENFEMFQPYLGIKLLALSVALFAPPRKWVGWTSFIIISIVPLVQYYHWPTVYRSQLGFQEPAMTLSFVIIAAALYVNRLHTLSLLRKEIIAQEKLAIYQRLGGLMVGLQHLNNTPLQTIEISLHLLKEKCPECISTIESMERSFHSVRRVNELLATGTAVSQKSASTIEEFEHDVHDIGEYLQT